LKIPSAKDLVRAFAKALTHKNRGIIQMTAILLTDAVRYGHLLSVAIGLGTAFGADVAAVGDLRKPISNVLIVKLHRLHTIIWPALGAMWASGLVLVYFRTGFIWDSFSPKLCAKLTVVTLLTLNAIMISRYALPMLVRNRGRLMAELPLGEQCISSLVSGVSSASWLLALAMGSSKLLADAGPEVFAALLPVVYGCATLSSLIVIRMFGRSPVHAMG
jgi:hypothetical protein